MELTYEEFIQKIKHDVCLEYKEKINDYELQNRYTTSYVSGGSCWDTEESRHYTVVCDVDDSDKEFKELNILLNTFFPNLKYSEYREIEKLIERETYTEYEYYNNSTTYAIQTINLLDIYQKLADYGYI
jgi:hypothetical protein